MPLSAMRRQAEILARCAEASYWMATRSGEEERALRIREAASLLEEVATAMRLSDRLVPIAAAPPAAPPAVPLRRLLRAV